MNKLSKDDKASLVWLAEEAEGMKAWQDKYSEEDWVAQFRAACEVVDRLVGEGD